MHREGRAVWGRLDVKRPCLPGVGTPDQHLHDPAVVEAVQPTPPGRVEALRRPHHRDEASSSRDPFVIDHTEPSSARTGNPEPDAVGKPDGNAKPERDSDSNAEPDADGNAEPDAERDSDSDSNAEPDAESKPNSESEPDGNAEPDAEPEPQPDSDVDSI